MQNCTAENPGTKFPPWVDVHSDRWWETTYTRVSWQYPPASDGRLLALASGSRLLRIAYSSGRGSKTEDRARLFPLRTLKSEASETSASTPTSTPTFPSTPTNLTSSTPPTSPSSSPPKPTSLLPCLTSSCAPTPAPENSSSRHPKFHLYRYSRVQSHPHNSKHHQKRYQWSKPPHYHASLLRSSLPRRRGRFRAILPPTEMVDFFRWEVTRPRFMTTCSCSGLSSSVQHDPCRNNAQHRTETLVSQALSVAESTLAPYEACAGFFGWRGLGIEVTPGLGLNHAEGFDRQEGYASDQSDNPLRSSVRVDVGAIDEAEEDEEMDSTTDIAMPIDEEAVEQGRVQWAEAVVGLVGALGSLGGGPRGELSGEKENVNPQRSDVGGKGGKQAEGFSKPSSSSPSGEPVRWDPNLRQDNTQPSHVVDSRQSSNESSAPSRPPNSNNSRRPSSNVPCVPSSSKASATQPPHVGPAKLPGESAKPKPLKDLSMPSGSWFPPPPPTRVSSRFPLPPPPFAPWYGAAVAGLGHPRVVPHHHPYGWWYNIKTGPGPGPGQGNHGNVNTSTTTTTSSTTWLSGDPDFIVKQNFAAGVSPSPLPVCDTQSPNAIHRPGASDGGAVGSSETDRGYESTTDTCTDSDPVPWTPTGIGDGTSLNFAVAINSKVAAPNKKDGEMEVMKNFGNSCSANSSPVKPLSLLTAAAPSGISASSAPTSSSTSTQSELVFPSLNGTFRQTRPTSLHTATRAQQHSVESTVRLESGRASEEKRKLSSTEPKDIPFIPPPSPSSSSSSSSAPARQANLSPIRSVSPSPSLPSLSTSPTGSTGFRKDSQGFWEPVTPPMSPVESSSIGISPSSRSTHSNGSRKSESRSLELPVSCVPRKPSVDSSAVPLLSPTVAPASFALPASPPQSPSVPSTSRQHSLSAAEPELTSLQFHPASDVSNPTTLLPAFLASAVKRKRGSRTREIVDRLKLGSESSNEPSGNNSQTGFSGLDWANGVVQSSSTAENDGSAMLSPSNTSSHVRSRSGSSARSSISGLRSELGAVSMSMSVSEKGSGSTSTALTSPGLSPVSVSASRSDSVRKSSLGSISKPDHSSSVLVKANSHPKVSPTSPAEWIELTSSVPNIAGGTSRRLSNAEWPKLGASVPPKVAQPPVSTTVTHPPTTRPHMSSVSSPAGTNAHLPPILPPPPLPPQSMVHPQTPSQPLPPQMFAVPYFAYPQYGYPFGQFQGPTPPQGQMQGQGTWMAMYRPPQPPHPHIPPHLHPPGTITGASGMRHVSW